MADAIDAILEYLQQHNFKTAEAALKAELKSRDGEHDDPIKSDCKDVDSPSAIQIQSSQKDSLGPAINPYVEPEMRHAHTLKSTHVAGKIVDEVWNEAFNSEKRDIHDDASKSLKKSIYVENFSRKSCPEPGLFESQHTSVWQRLAETSDTKAELLHVQHTNLSKADSSQYEGPSLQREWFNFDNRNQGSGTSKDLVSLQNDITDSKSQNLQKVGQANEPGVLQQREESTETPVPYVQWPNATAIETKKELSWVSPEGVDLGCKMEKPGLQHGKVYPLDEVGSPQATKLLCPQMNFPATGIEEEKSLGRLQQGVFQHDENDFQLEKVTVVQECFPSEMAKHTESTSYRQESSTVPSERSNCEAVERFQGFLRQGILVESGKGNTPYSRTWQEESREVTLASSVLPKLMYTNQHSSQFSDVRSCKKERLFSHSMTGSVEAQNCSQDGSGSSQGMAVSCDGDLNLLELASADCLDTSEEIREVLPKLPPVRLKSWDKTLEPTKELFGLDIGTSEENMCVNTASALEASFGLGSFLDVPIGQDISSSGGKRLPGNSRPSVSQGIVEDASDLLSGFATAGDGHSESVIDYQDEYWDSDAYDDDDDPGYLRQPIDDEAWFLANELFYPSENGRSRPSRDYTQAQLTKDYKKCDDDEHSYVDSYFSGEEVYRSRGALKDHNNEEEEIPKDGSLSRGRVDYDGNSLDPENVKQIRADPAWQGFVENDELYEEDKDRNMKESLSSQQTELLLFDDSKPSIIGLPPVNKNLVRQSVEVKESFQGKRGEKGLQDLTDIESTARMASSSSLSRIGAYHNAGIQFDDSDVAGNSLDVGIGRRFSDEEEGAVIFKYQSGCDVKNTFDIESESSDVNSCKQDAIKGSHQRAINNVEIFSQEDKSVVGIGFGGFSFPSPSSTGDIGGSRTESGKLMSAMDVLSRGDEADDYGIVGPDDTLASWRRQSSESSPIIGSRDAHHQLGTSGHSTGSGHSTDESHSREGNRMEDDDGACERDDPDAVADLDEVAAVQEQIQRLQAEEDDFEIFDLRIIHRKNRTGFEEEKDFPVVINSVIAGRYHITEYLGSAAFSKAIQAHDLHTGVDVCMKIIKNNKDFFDQSLDEIKLLKYINRHDPADKYHILRLYDYFYHREHLFIVCELLRANLYEFHKYNRESGGEVYFTMPRLQCITRQCLEALNFLHGLGLIHCDLKPENILVKSYSRCEVKVIDLGSSCFQTDHLCSYVQSRSYRAPEVILGLPYNQKIDIWSLGCILAELCSGNVLFQNDSLATLLARVVGILGPIDPDMLAKGHDIHKYFTKSHKLYERNPDTDRLEYLLPKKTSLAHRLPMGDQGFVDFVDYLLQINPQKRPSASEALKHPWLSFPYEPISS
ncbi:hypothetical protein O6H91_05G021000 [Diphasiastrum complanatum]|uniref:Uncharacterized protein n=3 Tax=Diphasiastrum complanatum TaxID=34168 RepID=A0ACC2DLX0_DIPCM|nr:hypothetical protein O6H91_05G021000 [Diphasiastrum complanatum]KAJ7555070.1 hypothetical protein O6H91_05G021000 [Diphasiastrum complanatum]